VLQNYFSFWIEDEPYVEEAVFQVGVARFGLRHDKGIVLARNLAQFFGFFARYIDSALTRELDVIQIKNFVIEGLQPSLRDGDQAYRNIQRREPAGGLYQVFQVVKIDLDVFAAANPAHGGNQAYGSVRFH